MLDGEELMVEDNDDFLNEGNKVIADEDTDFKDYKIKPYLNSNGESFKSFCGKVGTKQAMLSVDSF